MKVEDVKYAEINCNRDAGQKYVVYEKIIREWQKNKNKIAFFSVYGSVELGRLYRYFCYFGFLNCLLLLNFVCRY